MKLFRSLLIILVITLISGFIAIPESANIDTQIAGYPIKLSYQKPPLNIQISDNLRIQKDISLKQGLDLAGGLQITLKLDTSTLPDSEKSAAIESSREVIARRIDLFGVTEPNIYSQTSGTDYFLIAELPGLQDPQKALDLIGSTAQLEFRTPIFDTTATDSAEPLLSGFAPTDLTGKDLKKAEVSFNTEDSRPAVSLLFNEEGTRKFAQITKDNLGKPVAIFLDDTPVTMPTVQSEITGGQAIISGQFTVEDAKKLAIQLNAGALPVPISIESQTSISPTLGSVQIAQAVKGGLVGLLLVCLFMILLYGRFGLISVLGLVVYSLLNMALYKLIPITLSLPGLAGFILSIGMAVDSNILIFERYKEEIRAGKEKKTALELAFGRAWDSIKDANTTTLITAFILFNPLNWSFLPTNGPIRGFALTLTLGIITSLFTGIFVTRNLLRFFMQLSFKIKLPSFKK